MINMTKKLHLLREMVVYNLLMKRNHSSIQEMTILLFLMKLGIIKLNIIMKVQK